MCEGLASSFFSCTDTFPCADAAVAAATVAGFGFFAGSTLGTSAFTVLAGVL